MHENQYVTTSLPLAAAILLVSTSKLLDVDKTSSSQRASFVFSHTDDLPKVIELFWDKSLPVDALSYFETVKAIKSRLYEEVKTA